MSAQATVELPRSVAQRAPRRGRRRRSELWFALAMIAPAGLGFLVFYLYPTIRGFYLSLTEYSLLGSPTYVGTENFQAIAHDEVFWTSLRVTILYVLINIVSQTVLAIGLGVLMHRLTKSALIRGSLLLPYLIANVVVALLWFWLLDYHIGIVNAALDSLGLTKVAFFGSSTWAIPTIALVNTWRHMGYTALLIFAGMQTIPKSVYEAAAVDGASEWRMFWKITMPLLRPILVLVLVITVTGSFQVFDTVAVTTNGGPGNASRVLQLYIFDQAFGRSHFGYASALSVVLFVILIGVAFAQMRLMRAGESDLD
ncbi:sugar ABC transporter permease [Actinotalea sp. M2MS4P-6]|uniref:carbohydrate ABC transporter permease n=1 Tax=Actinotalea sp. M2MS4P-6 TaxID=2983762 RepID=UPI0021E45A92|nr:sugar ABC transporter permease [Actinotalea sp. M2MS4P-6]MCV2395681.1 sugar ABC transporter permease [Actinotalea sp. M2MS4P-6]